MRIQVQMVGDERLRIWLAATPVALKEAVWIGMEASVAVVAQRTRAVTPRLTGELAVSISTKVDRTSNGARGWVFSNVRYARFVEVGTKAGRKRKRKRAGRSNTIVGRRTKGVRMFRQGMKDGKPRVQAIFHSAVDRAFHAP